MISADGYPKQKRQETGKMGEDQESEIEQLEFSYASDKELMKILADNDVENFCSGLSEQLAVEGTHPVKAQDFCFATKAVSYSAAIEQYTPRHIGESEYVNAAQKVKRKAYADQKHAKKLNHIYDKEYIIALKANYIKLARGFHQLVQSIHHKLPKNAETVVQTFYQLGEQSVAQARKTAQQHKRNDDAFNKKFKQAEEISKQHRRIAGLAIYELLRTKNPAPKTIAKKAMQRWKKNFIAQKDFVPGQSCVPETQNVRRRYFTHGITGDHIFKTVLYTIQKGSEKRKALLWEKLGPYLQRTRMTVVTGERIYKDARWLQLRYKAETCKNFGRQFDPTSRRCHPCIACVCCRELNAGKAPDNDNKKEDRTKDTAPSKN